MKYGNYRRPTSAKRRLNRLRAKAKLRKRWQKTESYIRESEEKLLAARIAWAEKLGLKPHEAKTEYPKRTGLGLTDVLLIIVVAIFLILYFSIR